MDVRDDVTIMNAVPLIYIPNPKPNALLRLLCFPYAGGSSATYIPWKNTLSPDIELAVVQLPGRGIRLSDSPYQTMMEVVNALFVEIQTLIGKPFIFYGHSMGARIAYELALMLYQRNCELPIHLIASGSIAPCTDLKTEKIHHLPDKTFIEKVASLNGTATEVLANQEIMQLVLPALRADFKIVENYHREENRVLPTKISVFAGKDENVCIADLESWFDLFQYNTGIHWIAGNHFFIDKNPQAVLRLVDNLHSLHWLPSITVKQQGLYKV